MTTDERPDDLTSAQRSMRRRGDHPAVHLLSSVFILSNRSCGAERI
jgi:hypothetical protein